MTYREACKLLGPEGDRLIHMGGKHDIDLEEQVRWEEDRLRIHLGDATVTFLLTPEMPKSLRFQCDSMQNLL